MNELPQHLSYSSISTFIKCPELWYRKYILGEREEPQEALIIGKAFHLCMEENFTHKLAHGADLSRQAVEGVFKEAFHQTASNDGLDKDKTNEIEPLAWKLVEQYHREIASFIIPSAVERKLEINLPGKHIKKLIGYVDLINDKGVVIDYKAAAWPWPDAQVTQSLQPTVYGLMLGKPTLNFEYHMVIKSDGIRKEKFGDGIVIKSTFRRQKDFDWLVNMIQKMINLLESDDFYSRIVPNPGNQCLNCPSRKTCGYRTR